MTVRLDGHDDDSVVVLKIDVNHEHPAPRTLKTKREPDHRPLAPDRAEESDQVDVNALLEPLLGVLWQAVGTDQSNQVGRGRPGS
jgi:hypothetical protein